MPRFLITPVDKRIPAVRLVADDLVGLGEQAAAHFASHRALRRGITYDALMGDTGGLIKQEHLPRPIAFTISKES